MGRSVVESVQAANREQSRRTRARASAAPVDEAVAAATAAPPRVAANELPSTLDVAPWPAADASGAERFFVRSLAGATIALVYRAERTLDEVAEALEAYWEIPRTMMRFIVAGHQIYSGGDARAEPPTTLAQAGIRAGSTVRLNERLRW